MPIAGFEHQPLEVFAPRQIDDPVEKSAADVLTARLPAS